MSNEKHDCIGAIRTAMMQEDSTIKSVRFELSSIVSMDKRGGDFKTAQEVSIVRKHTKKDGSVVDKTEKTFVTHQYCPFCGEKYS
jgi:hypothetical protein